MSKSPVAVRAIVFICAISLTSGCSPLVARTSSFETQEDPDSALQEALALRQQYYSAADHQLRLASGTSMTLVPLAAFIGYAATGTANGRQLAALTAGGVGLYGIARAAHQDPYARAYLLGAASTSCARNRALDSILNEAPALRIQFKLAQSETDELVPTTEILNQYASAHSLNPMLALRLKSLSARVADLKTRTDKALPEVNKVLLADRKARESLLAALRVIEDTVNSQVTAAAPDITSFASALGYLSSLPLLKIPGTVTPNVANTLTEAPAAAESATGGLTKGSSVPDDDETAPTTTSSAAKPPAGVEFSNQVAVVAERVKAWSEALHHLEQLTGDKAIESEPAAVSFRKTLASCELKEINVPGPLTVPHPDGVTLKPGSSVKLPVLEAVGVVTASVVNGVDGVIADVVTRNGITQLEVIAPKGKTLSKQVEVMVQDARGQVQTITVPTAK